MMPSHYFRTFRLGICLFLLTVPLFAYYLWNDTSISRIGFVASWSKGYGEMTAQAAEAETPFLSRLAQAAEARAKAKVVYEGSYREIPYPNGDVPPTVGVCSDEIVRSYRAVGIDLQKEVHEDMLSSFLSYPKMWHALHPDANIDHRRVPNLMTFFARHGEKLPLSSNPAIYHPGEIVAWELTGGLLHIGIVVTGHSPDGVRPLILHNIGAGPQIEDALFVGKIIGHFRYQKNAKSSASRDS